MAYDAHGNRARAVRTDRPTLATGLHELRHGREVLLSPAL